MTKTKQDIETKKQAKVLGVAGSTLGSGLVSVSKPRKYDARGWSDIGFAFGSAKKVTPEGPEAQQFVRQQVRMHAQRPKYNPTGMLVQCPFHRSDNEGGFSRTLNVNVIPHEDNHQHHVTTGAWRCWSCGRAGLWNELAAETGMEQLPETDNYELGDNARKIEYEIEYEPPNSALLVDLDVDWCWRHKDVKVPYKTLLAVGAMFHELPVYTESNMTVEKRLWLPCYVDGELLGHVDAALNGEQPKYLNAKGPWAKSTYLYWDVALKFAKHWRRKHGTQLFIFVCEGPASAIALLRWGIPAVACLGVENWSQAKAVQLGACYDVVFALGDGDRPGYDLNDTIKADMSGLVRCVKKLKLARDIDPAKFRSKEHAWLEDVIEKYARKSKES